MFQSETQRLQLITWAVLLFLPFVSVLRYGGNADDAYWHIKIGEWILAHHQVPTTGIFSHTNPDTPWVSHEWLSEVILYKVFQYGNWAGLVFLTMFSSFTTILIVLWFLLKRLSTVQSLIFVLFAYLLLLPHFSPRPHILAIPIMTYWTACLIEACEKQGRPPFHILPLMILWVNMHGSFIAGIAFSVFFAAETVFYATSEARKKLVSSWMIFILAALLATATTPHGFAGWLLPFQVSNQSYATSRIGEWLSPDFHNFQPLELWLLSFLTLTLMQGIKLPVFRLVFLLGLLHLSLKHQRYVNDLLSVLSPLILASPLAKHWHSQSEINFNEVLPKTYKSITIFVICFAGLFFYLAQMENIEMKSIQQAKKVLQVLKPEQSKLGNVLNNYGIGDFLIHEGYQTFIDPRSEMYGDKFMKDYFDAIELGESSKRLEDMIAKYHVTWTFFYTSYPINTYLATQPNWVRLYSDKVLTIYVSQAVKLSSQMRINLKETEKQALAEQKKFFKTYGFPVFSKPYL